MPFFHGNNLLAYAVSASTGALAQISGSPYASSDNAYAAELVVTVQ